MPLGEILTILCGCNLRFDKPANWHSKTSIGFSCVGDDFIFESKTTVAIEVASDAADWSFQHASGDDSST